MSDPVQSTAPVRPSAADLAPSLPYGYSRRRVRWGLAITLIGFVLLLIGIRPSLFGLDRSPIIGVVQISVFLLGLGLMCIGGYICMMALWKGQPISITADIGLRLICTGYVIAVFAGMADIFGFGSHPFPQTPYFGPLQALGVEIGQGLIAVGFLMLLPYNKLFQPTPHRRR